VKGKEAPVKIYTVLDKAEDPDRRSANATRSEVSPPR
jgi:hypothetical protein